MNFLFNAGNMPRHNSVFLKERKFFTVLPLLVIPFLTLLFWALDGGKRGQYETGGRIGTGLNTTLPQAQVNNQDALDKMKVYQNEKTDSSADGVSESFVKAMGFKSHHDAADTAARNVDNASATTTLSPEESEAKINARLEEINKQISRPAPVWYTGNVVTPPANPEVKRLEAMMKAVNIGSGDDPEMKQLSDMLGQINELQHPGNTNNLMRNRSLKYSTRVYPVIALKNDDVDESDPERPEISSAALHEGFKSPTRGSSNSTIPPGNTIQAVVHEDQTLVSGAVIKLRLQDGIYIKGRMVPKGSFVYGTCALNNERLEIKITSIRYLNNIFPVALSVYDLDGMEGLYVPGSISRDAAKDGMGNAVQSMQLMAMNQSLGTQAASAGVEAAKGLFNHKVKQIKIKVKAGYEVLLKDLNDRGN